jgi:hypothetical protein
VFRRSFSGHERANYGREAGTDARKVADSQQVVRKGCPGRRTLDQESPGSCAGGAGGGKRALERIIPATSTELSRVFAVEGRGRDLFAAAERLHLEGIVAKRKTDAYALGTVWFKIKNGAYTQMEGRGELFHPPRRYVLPSGIFRP